jgi:endogenous inhibitor of DNA gyrase (YacG/DUF329 family)
MIQGRCPICSTPFEIARLDDLPSFPFCSPRCRQLDLGRWIDGSYAIPGAPAAKSAAREDEPAVAAGRDDPDAGG